MDWLKKRAAEPSTYPGLAALVLGLGTIFKVKEAPEVAQVIGQASEPFVSGDWMGGAMITGLGLAGIFMREKGE